MNKEQIEILTQDLKDSFRDWANSLQKQDDYTGYGDYAPYGFKGCDSNLECFEEDMAKLINDACQEKAE